MGVLRLTLALIVVIFHCPPGIVPHILHSALSVQCFYAISGFLIQLVIGKYSQSGERFWYINFYKSRAFRLYPLYWIFTLLFFIFFNNGMLFDFVSHQDYLGTIVYLVNNTLLFGQDILRLYAYDLQAHHFIFYPPFHDNFNDVYNNHIMAGSAFTLMGQSWTLAVEIWFYLFAPFILLRSSRWIIFCIIIGITSRILWAQNGYLYHTFLYGIILNEISVFLGGALAARFYVHYKNWLSTNKGKLLMSQLIGFTLLFLLLYFYYEGWQVYSTGGGWNKGLFSVPYNWWLVILLTILCLPFIFQATSRLTWDRFIGDLSYPVYINHFFILEILNTTPLPKDKIVLYTIIISIITAIILLYLVERPLDNWRHKKFLKK